MISSASTAFRPLQISKNTTSYSGPGYRYHLRKSPHDVIAKLKISSELFQKFVKCCGSINTIQLRGLTVAYQGGGWYEIFVLIEQLCPSVLQFVKRLNQWALNHIQQGPRPHRGLNYVLEVRVHEHPPIGKKTMSVAPPPNLLLHSTPALPIKPIASLDRLQMLAQTVNARFGH